MASSETLTGTSPLERISFEWAAMAFAPAYALHILEEFPRFIAWTHEYPAIYGAHMTKATFWVGDGLFILYVATCLVLVWLKRDGVGVVATLSLPFWVISNGAAHIGLTLAFNQYSPGALTAAGLYMPLSILLFDRAKRQALLTKGRVAIAAILGFGVQRGVLLLGHTVG